MKRFENHHHDHHHDHDHSAEPDTMVLDRFIKNAILKSSAEHDTGIKTKEAYFERLQKSGLFTIDEDEITFNLKALEKNEKMKKAFMNSLEECLLFDYVEKLKYEQYGLNDFYWALEKQNKKQPHSQGHKHHLHHKHLHTLLCVLILMLIINLYVVESHKLVHCPRIQIYLHWN